MPRQEPLDPTFQQRIYAVVRQIPTGQVASYGQISRIAGYGITARMVGYALAGLHGGSDVPWQRVINAQGQISLPGIGGAIQKKLLLEEGIEFDENDKISFKRFGWLGPDA